MLEDSFVLSLLICERLSVRAEPLKWELMENQTESLITLKAIAN